MDPRQTASLFLAVLLFILGVSHVAHPRLWSGLFRALLHQPWAGLVIGTLTLPFGLALVLAHNDWSLSPGLATTIVGWGWSIKGTLYLLSPGLPRRVGARHMQHPRRMAVAGAALVALSVLCALDALSTR